VIHWTGVPEFAAALEKTVARASIEARAAVVEVASELEKAAKQNASGRPGPNVISGTLRRSLKHDPVEPWGVAGWRTRVGPTVIYARRIELGFRGVDSLGRLYDDFGYPYFEPAFDRVRLTIPAVYAKHWQRALTGV
jgi:hypothetical protein